MIHTAADNQIAIIIKVYASMILESPKNIGENAILQTIHQGVSLLSR